MKNEELSESQASFVTPHPCFAIKTPTATVTDLGTEFGVEVDETGRTSATVFQGVVELQTRDASGPHTEAIRLGENESARVERANAGGEPTIQRTEAKTSGFVRVGQLPSLAEEAKLKSFRRWQSYSQEVRRDPSLLAYFDFQQKQGMPTVLANVAENGQKSPDGIVENATWTTGRMPGKHALLFTDSSDSVHIELPQGTEDIAIAAWLRVESLDHCQTTGLVMSVGFGNAGQPQYFHWQMNNRLERVMFSVASGREPGSEWFCDTDIKSWLNRWTHLVCSYNHITRLGRLYVDGRLRGESEAGPFGPICIGAACIGAWDGGGEPRNFRGKIDELMVFGRSLDSLEVQRMFDQGKP